MPTFKQVSGFIILVIVLACVALLGKVFEYVGAGDICVMQYPSGTLKVFATPGWKFQWFGDVKHYKKSFQFWFAAKDAKVAAPKDGGDSEAIKCRFNEGGHADISGSCRVDLPQDQEAMLVIHTKYGSQEAVEHELVRTSLERAVYMSGPLMSSQESSAEKRPLLLTYVEDQAASGVYSTTVKDVKMDDPITGEKKTVSVVEIKMDDKGVPFRGEASPLQQFKIKLYGLSINRVDYDPTVEKQIAQQQQAKMSVQIAIANSKRAEQDALTAVKEGEANAAKAKWLQEVEKATEVTKAEKEAAVAKINAERDVMVAELALKAAEQTKMKDIALGEGESTRMKLVMQANGALEMKLKTYEAVNAMYATALGNFKGSLVPAVMMGGAGNATGNSAMSFIDLLTAKAAKDLSLDFTMNVQAPVAPPAK